MALSSGKRKNDLNRTKEGLNQDGKDENKEKIRTEPDTEIKEDYFAQTPPQENTVSVVFLLPKVSFSIFICLFNLL